MQRPFFSLAILLEIIAISLFLVSSAHSQTGVPSIDVPSSTVHGCGWLWQGTSGQEIRRNFVEVMRAIQSRTYVVRLEERTDYVPWTVADDSVVVPPAFVSTGYDAAYDFAMFEGQYYNLASSRTDIEGATELAENDPEIVPDVAISSPAPSRYFDDFNCCMDSGFNRWINEDAQASEGAGEVAWGSCEADGIVEPSEESLTVEEAQQTWQHIHVALERTIESAATLWQSYSAPFAQSETKSLSDADAQLAWEQLKGAATRTVEVLKIGFDSSWKPFAHPWLITEAKNLSNISMESFVLRKPTFPVASTVSLTEGQQIVILTKAAVTLDEIGLYLQEAAQRLRYLAADRIVAKSNSRCIAREGNR